MKKYKAEQAVKNLPVLCRSRFLLFQHPEYRFNVVDFVRQVPDDNFVTTDLDEMCCKGACSMSMIYNERKAKNNS